MDLEYDLILGEDENSVLFLIAGREVKLPRSKIESFDYEGRLRVSVEVAKEFDLTEATSV
jgi:hypothetical protein